MAESKNFSPEFWRAVAWTGIYVFIMWAVLRGLFHFNMFSAAHWAKMARIELHGFAGFVFAILILAAVPMYIATTLFTLRNKVMPIKFPLPNCLVKPATESKPFVQEPIVSEAEVLPQLPQGVPAEMRETFMRARKNYGVHQMSVFNRPAKFDDTPLPVPQVEHVRPVSNNVENITASTRSNVTKNITAEESDFPIPTDFDTPVAKDSDVPVFSDINFDDDEEDSSSDTEQQNVPEYIAINEIISGAGHKTAVQGNLIVVGDFAIAVHNDDDFWVADEIDWFAAGRQKPSPIIELMNAQKNDKLQPVLYLGADNIMDLDKLTKEWRKDGIDIVTSTDDLLNLIKHSPKD
ncbi:MAG: hypothetical protein J5742_00980 [Alphaproteobacteria bacterium]|nr:hypothetical protein [Alphaproteobacteria bacterium]